MRHGKQTFNGIVVGFLLLGLLGISSRAWVYAAQAVKKGQGQRPTPSFNYEGSLDVRIHPNKERLTPPAELLLRDPRERKTGKDPQTDKNYQEIPDSDYERERIDDDISGARGPEAAIITIRNPVSGSYHLQVIGTEAGDYSLEIRGEARDRNPSVVQFTHVQIQRGDTHHYRIRYSNKPGAKVKATRVKGSILSGRASFRKPSQRTGFENFSGILFRSLL